MEVLIVIYWISVAICLFGLLKRGIGLSASILNILLSFFPPINMFFALNIILDYLKKPEKIKIFHENVGKIREFIRINQADSAKDLFDILQCPSDEFEREYKSIKNEVDNALAKLTEEKRRIQEEEKRKREIRDQEQRKQPEVSDKDAISGTSTKEIIIEKTPELPKVRNLRQILYQYNEKTIIPQYPDRANGILRKEMLDLFVNTKPITRGDFVEGFPNAWRQQTDRQQMDYLAEILAVIDDYISENPGDQKEIYPVRGYNDDRDLSKEEWRIDVSCGSRIKVIIRDFSRAYRSGAYTYTKILLGIKVYSDESSKHNRMERWEEYWNGDDFNEKYLDEIVDWLNSMEKHQKDFDDTEEFMEIFDRIVHHSES